MIQIQRDEILPVGILPKNLAALDPSTNDMMQGTCGIAAGLARHAFYLPRIFRYLVNIEDVP